MGWERSGRVLLWATIAILAWSAGRGVYRGFRPAPARAASTAAYTVLRTEKVFDNTGTLEFTNHYVEAVRSDGSRMRRSTTRDLQKREIYFANGDRVTTNELAGLKSTYPNVGQPAPRDPKASCTTTEELASGRIIGGEDNIGGYRAVRLVNLLGASTLTMWYGLDLGCAVLQQRFQHETGITDQDLAAVIPGEPDAALFQLSASLKEVPPSRLFACPDGLPGCTELSDRAQRRIDGQYYDARAKAAAAFGR